MSWSIEVNPIVSNMSFTSFGRGPMWRAAKFVLDIILFGYVPKLATEININEQSLPNRFDFDDWEVKVLDGDGSIINTHTYKKMKNE